MENAALNSHLSLTEGCSLEDLTSWHFRAQCLKLSEIPEVKSSRCLQWEAVGIS